MENEGVRKRWAYKGRHGQVDEMGLLEREREKNIESDRKIIMDPKQYILIAYNANNEFPFYANGNKQQQKW